MASGLAASIRGSTESDTFDLAGQNTTTVTTNITAAFRDPFPIHEMIRITFVTGAGKLGRQKYDEGCAKAVTSALRDLGFEEDRASSCVNECAGCFKLQHDTGKNLKTVVVFPNITTTTSSTSSTTGGGDNNNNNNNNDGSPSLLLKPGSPEEMIALSPVTMFPNLIQNKLQSWSQKKGCASSIAGIRELIAGLERRLFEGVVLDDSEQALYDTVSLDDLKAKQALVREAMQKQVETDGDITPGEKAQLLSQVSDRIETITSELEAAAAVTAASSSSSNTTGQSKKPKKAAVKKLTNMKTKAEERKALLSKINPKPPAPLRFHKEIAELRKELVPLTKLEETITRGRLLSVKETKTLARKETILERIKELEDESRGWFEDDASFAARAAQQQQQQSSGSGNKKSSSNSSGNSKKKGAAKKSGVGAWVTSSSSSSSMSRPRAKTGAKKKKSGGSSGGGVFAAMMMDDSDDDDSD